MAKHRDFGTVRTEPSDEEPKPGLTFTLQGNRRATQEPWSETFTCLADPPAGALDNVMRMVATDRHGQTVLSQASIVDFVEAVLIPEDEQRWRRLVADKDRLVPFQQLADVAEWVQEELFGPLTAPSG